MKIISVILLSITFSVLLAAEPSIVKDDTWEEHKVLGKVSCKKNESLVVDTKISLWFKTWDAFVPTFHECT